MLNYLKKFESLQSNDEIHQICREYNITNYTINSDGSIDVDGNVNLSSSKIDIEILNALLYDQGKPPVENVKGYDNI